jgi:hypothetical protein
VDDADTTQLPSEAEVSPWYNAICALWDDGDLYRAVAARGREIAGVRYGEAASRITHVDYFTSLEPGHRAVPGVPGQGHVTR